MLLKICTIPELENTKPEKLENLKPVPPLLYRLVVEKYKHQKLSNQDDELVVFLEKNEKNIHDRSRRLT